MQPSPASWSAKLDQRTEPGRSRDSVEHGEKQISLELPAERRQIEVARVPERGLRRLFRNHRGRSRIERTHRGGTTSVQSADVRVRARRVPRRAFVQGKLENEASLFPAGWPRSGERVAANDAETSRGHRRTARRCCDGKVRGESRG